MSAAVALEEGGDGWWDTLRRQDLRLVPAAATTWLGGLLGVRLAWPWAVACGTAGVLVGVLLALRCRRSPVLRLVAWTLLVSGVAVAASTGLRLRHDQANPLRVAAADGTRMALLVEVGEPASPVHSVGFGSRRAGVRAEVLHGTVLAVRRAAGWTAADGAIVLITPVRGWEHLLRGQRVTVRGRLAPPYPGQAAVAVVRVSEQPAGVAPASAVQRAAEVFRAGLRTAAASMSGPSRGLLPGLVIGDRSTLSEQVAQDFRTSGMAYLTAVGGWHFMIVIGAVLLLLRLLRAPPQLSALIGGAVLLAFLEIAGPRPSVLRAAVMVAVLLLAMATGRSRSTVGALCAAVIGLVLAKPSFAADTGFALSVLATGALLLAVPPLVRLLRRRGIPAGFAELLAVATAAHLATAPVIAAEFGAFSTVSVLANVLAEPAFVPAMVLGTLAMAASPLAPPVAASLAQLAQPATGWLIGVAHWTAGVPAASIPWPEGWPGALALIAAIAGAVLLLRLRKARVLLLVCAVSAVLLFVPARIIGLGWPPDRWAMVDCDVGQGDAEVLATDRPHRAVLVDTGPDPEAVAGCLHRLGITHVPLVVLSHLHADHVGGLAAVLRHQQVGAVAVGVSRQPAWAWQQVRQEARAAHVPIVQLRRGEQLSWPGLTLRVLGPEPEDALPDDGDDSGTAINDTSVVLKAVTAAGRVLLTGDIELRAQADLLADGADVTADILKIPHHGSRYSAPKFLAAVHARIAVASAGQGNPYGHPSPVTLRRLRADGATVLCTNRAGDIAIVAGASGPLVVRRGDPRPPPDAGP